jgi:hypothetical protein
MLAKNWLDDRMGSAAEVAQAGLAAASKSIAANVQHAEQALARHGASGLDYARAIGGEMRRGSQQLARSTRQMAKQRPVESAVVITLAVLAAGWIWWRSSREETTKAPSAAQARARSKRTSRAG